MRSRLSRIDPFIAAAVVLPAVPIIVAVARALLDGWFPMSDQVVFEIRAGDVLTAHHPLLGTGSSASLNRPGAIPLNHPGPLMYDLLALPVKLFGGAGVAIGVGAVNLAATVIGTLFAARRAGRAGAAAAAFAFAGLAWAAGSESLFDPFNPTAAMLPCLSCLVLAWCTIDGDGVAFLWLLGVVSFVVQLHNSYLLYLAPIVALAGALYIGRAWRRGDAGLRRTGLLALVVLALVWAQPLIEQLLHGRDGNIARMVRSLGVLGSNPGPRVGTQVAAATLTVPPWWGRSGFEGIQIFTPMPDLAVAAGSLALVVVAGTAACWWVWRHRGGDTTAAVLLTAVASTAVAWVASIRAPTSPFYGLGAGYVRWLWPASVFLWFAVGLTAWRLLAPHRALTRRVGLAAATVVLAVVSLANVPRHFSVGNQQQLADLRPVAEELIARARTNLDAPAIVYRQVSGFDILGPSVVATLQNDGVEFFVDDPYLIRQFGERRRYRDQDLPELRVLNGLPAVDVRRDPNVIAFVSHLSDQELDDLWTTALDIGSWLRDGRIELSAAGEATVAAGFAEGWFAQVGTPGIDAASVSRSLSLADAIDAGLLHADPQAMATLQRFAEMRREVETSTAAVLLTPPDGAPADL